MPEVARACLAALGNVSTHKLKKSFVELTKRCAEDARQLSPAFADAIDELGNPDALTLARIKGKVPYSMAGPRPTNSMVATATTRSRVLRPQCPPQLDIS